jgi:CSLREA domain-containing protein
MPSADAQSSFALYLPQVQWMKLPIANALVTTQEDELNIDGDCSLREAIQATNTNQPVDDCLADVSTELVLLPTGIYTLTHSGAHEDNNLTGDLDITGTLTISGIGGDSPIINGNQRDRVLQVLATGNVTLTHVTIYDGRTSDGADSTTARGGESEAGGGIDNRGILHLVASTVISNSTGDGGAGGAGQGGGNAGHGGAIFNVGVLVASQSKFLNNRTGDGGLNSPGACRSEQMSQGGAGGAIYNPPDGTARFFESLLENNRTGQGSFCVDPPGMVGGQGAKGGGIANLGQLRLEKSTLSRNQSGDGGNVGGSHSLGGDGGDGGGLWNGGTGYLLNSTISGNRTGKGGDGGANGGGDGGDGAGIGTSSSLTLTHVTISANVTGQGGLGIGQPSGRGGDGGGIYAERTAALSASLIGGNSAAQLGADCTGSLQAYDFNLLQDINNCTITQEGAGRVIIADPLLAPLADNGGATWTHALKAHSPALDMAHCMAIDGSPVLEDQRGVARPQGSTCDIGAFERAP